MLIQLALALPQPAPPALLASDDLRSRRAPTPRGSLPLDVAVCLARRLRARPRAGAWPPATPRGGLRESAAARAAHRRARRHRAHPLPRRSDLPRRGSLCADPLIVTVRCRCDAFAMHLRPIDRDHPDLHQPGPRAQRQHLGEQLRQRGLVALAELRDRRVIRHQVRSDHPIGHILDALPLDPPRGTVPAARTRRATAPPSSPGHTPADHDRRRDTRHRTRSDPSPRPHRGLSTRGGPPAPNPTTTAATRTTAHDRHAMKFWGMPGILLNPPDGALFPTATRIRSSRRPRADDAFATVPIVASMAWS